MKKITYSIICEDHAHKTFIQTFLSKFADKVQFDFNNVFYKRLLCNNSKDVLGKMVQAVDFSFLYKQGFYIDLLFIGIDYDDRNKSEFTQEIENLYNRLDERGKQKAIIVFPVQAIEHWLLFIKEKVTNAATQKNISKDIEKIERKIAKKILYTNHKEKVSIEKDVHHFTQQIDIEWLCSQSVSFNSFYTKFRTFIP